MNINEFFQETYCVIMGMQVTRPRIVCKDGFSMSVQAGRGIYSSPRLNLESGYGEAEVGFPSETEFLLINYAEDNDYTETVYPYVPYELIDKVIDKHGGIDEGKTFGRVEYAE